MWFRYRILDRDGALFVREGTADDAGQLAAQLAHQGFTPLEIKPIRPKCRPLSRQHQHLFFEQLAQLLEAGIPLHDACVELANGLEQTGLRQLAQHLAARIAHGASLSVAMSETLWAIPPVDLALIQAGEQSGRLVDILFAISRQAQQAHEQRSALQQQLLYPVFSALTLGAATGFLLLYLVPQLLPFLQGLGHALPWHTQALIWCSHALNRALPILIVLAGILPPIGRLLYQRHPELRQQWHRLLLALPLIGTVLSQLNTARISAAFSLMYAAGIPVHQTLSMLPNIAGNPWIRLALQRSELRVRNGMPLAPAFAAEPIFPAPLIRALRLGTHTGHLDTTLAQIAKQQSTAAQRTLDRLQRLCEPALTLCMGTLLCWILLALIGPIYDVIGQIKP